jgi:hypothetical protein
MRYSVTRAPEIRATLAEQPMLHGPRDLSICHLIAEHGIMPGDQVVAAGHKRHWVSESSDIQCSRNGHVYLGTETYIDECLRGTLGLFEVNTDGIEIDRLACDEDHVSLYTTVDAVEDESELHLCLPQSFERRYSASALMGTNRTVWLRSGPLGRPLTRAEHRRTGQTQGDWAARGRNAAALAHEDFVTHSLRCGSVAVRGSITPELISLHRPAWHRLCGRNRWRDHERDVHVQMSLMRTLALLVAGSAEREALASELLETVRATDFWKGRLIDCALDQPYPQHLLAA